MRRIPVAAALLIMVATVTAGMPRGSADASVATRTPEAAPPDVLSPLAEAPTVAEDSRAETPVAVKPAARQVDVPVSHVWQSLNNCGPASVVMLLSSYGIRVSQEEARLALRGSNVARGMGPQGVDPWVNAKFGLRAFSRNNGDAATLKVLISNGFVPMVTQWLYDPPSRVAHWRVIRGYDEDAGVFYVADPMRGAAVPLGYKWFDDNWRPFQYRYLVLYPPENEALLKSIIGQSWYDVPSRHRFLARAKDEAFALGTSEAWLSYGEAAYQIGRLEEAVAAFEKGMALGSATGVFNVRSSYPAALRLLGRDADALRAQERLASSTSRTVAAVPDPAEVRLVTDAGGTPSILYPNLAPQMPAPRRVVADPVQLD